MFCNDWMTKYKLAKNYYNHYGNLLIPKGFITLNGIDYNENGINLGNWIYTQRQIYNGTLDMSYDSNKINLLEQIGMVWSVYNNEGYISENWLEKYKLAKEYYNHYGNLLIPRDFKTSDGINYDEDGIILGIWLANQRKVHNGTGRGKLEDSQVKMLEDLNIKWRVRESSNNIPKKWLDSYNLAKSYYKKYGNLSINKNFKTSDGINYNEKGNNLGIWLRTQKSIYNGVIKGKLCYKQIYLLEQIGIEWFRYNLDDKLQNEKITEENTYRKQLEILNRFKSLLIKYKDNELPSKEEINKNFEYQLKR